MVAEGNLGWVRALLRDEAGRRGLREVMGVAPFSSVYGALMPVQQARLREFSGDGFDELIRDGSVVSIAFAYPEYVADFLRRRNGPRAMPDAHAHVSGLNVLGDVDSEGPDFAGRLAVLLRNP